ncbi:hypothetical protein [Methylorubrum aminovorans]|uniref:hypothetical protein n=1 Tax=Methylorubrum aminovorans TaxID=269069 RepID=UPI003C2E7CBA
MNTRTAAAIAPISSRRSEAGRTTSRSPPRQPGGVAGQADQRLRQGPGQPEGHARTRPDGRGGQSEHQPDLPRHRRTGGTDLGLSLLAGQRHGLVEVAADRGTVACHDGQGRDLARLAQPEKDLRAGTPLPGLGLGRVGQGEHPLRERRGLQAAETRLEGVGIRGELAADPADIEEVGHGRDPRHQSFGPAEAVAGGAAGLAGLHRAPGEAREFPEGGEARQARHRRQEPPEQHEAEERQQNLVANRHRGVVSSFV